jgi:hypothetical protein
MSCSVKSRYKISMTEAMHEQKRYKGKPEQAFRNIKKNGELQTECVKRKIGTRKTINYYKSKLI